MNIIKGKNLPPMRRVVYGPPGVGKTKFACSEPGALALDYEGGVEYLGVDRVLGATTWMESLALIREACEGPGDHKSVVIDTIDKLEAQAATHICSVSGVEGKKGKTLADFGYQGGYKVLAQIWRELLFACQWARGKGRNVTLVAHVQRTTVKDPSLGEYATYIAAIHKDCWSATHQWADAVLFANYEAGIFEGRAIVSGERVLHTVKGTGFEAKHRPNIAPVLPLSWDAYANAVSAANRTADEVVASIRSLATPETKDKAEEFITKANGDVLRLVTTESALKKKVS
jgi:AAA domain